MKRSFTQYMVSLTGISLLLTCLLATGYAQQLAFPEAEGGGRFAVGGRYGEVYAVTNLNDSGEGSLREAVSKPNRTVVFKVSGVIHLESRLAISQDSITIAGQTAPGDGICVTGYTLNIQASDIIIRYLRFRLSDVNKVEDDAMNAMSGDYHDIIIDHCSLSWSVDETGSFYGIKNFTLQWCILSESLYNSVHGKGKHGYGGIWGGENASFHHNLLAHHTSRNPRFGGSRYTGEPEKEIVDFRNNVLYNWGNGNSVYGGEGGNYNMVNNYYKAGPATPGNLTTSTASNKRNRILNYTSYYFSEDAAVYPDTLWGGKFYIEGNFVEGYPDVTEDNWTLGVQEDGFGGADTLIAKAKLDAPVETAPVTTQTAEEAYASVLQNVGATLPKRDEIDSRIIQEATNGTATYEGDAYAEVSGTGVSHPSGIIDTQDDVGGMPDYSTTTPPADSDGDGIPDDWEEDNGLDAADPEDAGEEGNEGYTHLENYLNSIESSASNINVNSGLGIFYQTIGTPSDIQSYKLSAADLTADITITPPEGYELSLNQENWYGHATSLKIAPSNGIVTMTTIYVRLNESSVGAHSGVIVHSSDGTSDKNMDVVGLATAETTVPDDIDVVVAPDGSGDYTSVQAAVDAAPSNSTTAYKIYIKKGVYYEQITIPSEKTYLQFIGESVAETILTYDNYSGKEMPGGGTYGTSNSASVIVNADNFTAINITFENSTGDAPQALAINVNADKASFKGCRFLGGQDTILTNGDGHRQYFKNCYIDGVVDFIFGPAIVVFDTCVVYAKSRQDRLSGSYITAANTPNGQEYGYIFRGCTLPSNTGVTQYVLGRPWQNATGSDPRSYPKVVFLNTTMGFDIVKPEGWSVWNEGTVTSEIYYAEYNSHHFDGSAIDVSQRVDWSYQLTESEANAYTLATVFSDWNPCADETVCEAEASPIAISNFITDKGDANTDISWNISWPIKGVKYTLYRSTDSVSFAKIFEVTAQTDTIVNFGYTDAIPDPGTTYYYFVMASLEDMSPHKTETLMVSSTSTITIESSLEDFLQGIGLPSAHQGYYISAENLTESLFVIPPEGFEVSDDQGDTWYTSSDTLVLESSAGIIVSTSIWIRLNASEVGTYSGVVSHESEGAETIEIQVSGVVQEDPLPVSETLVYWPFSSGIEDDERVRSSAVEPETPVLNNFYTSNGTTVTSIPDFSEALGMAFGPGEEGQALWTSSTGGPGGNLSRAHFIELQIASTEGNIVRVDSIVLNSSYYNTSSHTNLAVVYSKSGFKQDSTDVTGGVGADGNPLASTAYGAFDWPAALTKENGSTALNYRFALNAQDGVEVESGDSLAIRLYYSCGSTSEGRYAKLKDVYIKGEIYSAPTIEIQADMETFEGEVGNASDIQTYIVAGYGLTNSIFIVPDENFEVSLHDADVWKDNTTSLVLKATDGQVDETSIDVRMKATTVGDITGMITHSSDGAADEVFDVIGVATQVTSLEEVNSATIQLWPNPVQSTLMVNSAQAHQVKVYNELGVCVQTLDIAEGQNEIDASLWESGVYLMTFVNKEQVQINRIIKY